MKRMLLMLLVLGIVVGGTTTAAASRKKAPRPQRVVTRDYAPRSDGGRMLVAPQTLGVTLTQVSFSPTLEEGKVAVAIEDVSGLPVRARLYQFDAPVSDYFCGETDVPVSIASGFEMEVWVYSGPCGDGIALGTQGTITATFSP